MLLTEILHRSAHRYTAQPALTMQLGYRTLSLTYGEAYTLAQKIACFLSSQEIIKEDKIVLVAPNSPYWICLYWACLLQGIIIVPLNIQSTQDFIKKIIDQTQAKLLIVSSSLHHTLSFALRTLEIEQIHELVDPYSPSTLLSPLITENDVTQILYTSGTTGDPKGVPLTHKNIAANITALYDILPIKETRERLLSMLPLSHIFEQTIGFFLPFSAGAHIVYVHSYAAIRELLQEYQITKMVVVPEFLKILMDKIESTVQHSRKKKIFDILIKVSHAVNWKPLSRFFFRPILKSLGGKLDTIACGGAPLNPLLETKFNNLGILILQGYGLTETSPVITLNSPIHHRFKSVGKVLSNINISIAQDGEILIKGPSVFHGYYHNQKQTTMAFTPDGWFKTGDIGSFDDDGFLFIKGRKKYMIKGPGGQNVFPEDIEHALASVHSVIDCCILGLNQPSGAVNIHAVLLLEKDAPSPEIIVQQANANLAPYQHISSWTVWHEQDFPRTAMQKIKKEEVKKVINALLQKSSSPLKSDRQTPLQRILTNLSGASINQLKENTKIVQELQLDSLLRIELTLCIEEELGVVIDETKITNQTTLADLEQLIATSEPTQQRQKLARWPRWFITQSLRLLFQQFLFMVCRTFVTIKIHGFHNLNDIPLPVIFMPNHLSYFDSFALNMALSATLRKKLAYAAAQDVLFEEFKQFAFLGQFLFNAFPFPRKEHENIKIGLDNMGKLLDQGYSIVIFPEGKISKDGSLQKLKRGAGLIAIEMRTLVIPVRITGTNAIFPYKTIFPRNRGHITISFGKPLRFSRKSSYDQATQEIYTALQSINSN